MKSKADDFPQNANRALKNPDIAKALNRAQDGFVNQRRLAIATIDDYSILRQCGREIKEHTLNHLDYYLEYFEQQVQQQGGQVHFAKTPADARAIIIDICQKANAKHIIKGKSMVSEEVDLNPSLQAAGFEVVESDLGEYILQLADEPPSHIIAPAVHKSKAQVADLFYTHHQQYGYSQHQDSSAGLLDQARDILRGKFQQADVGITGANFLVAETGSVAIVTNEGNGDLTSTLPPVHVVIAGIEKLVPTLDDMSTLLRLLSRNATGQETAVYTTVLSGPRRDEDLDGPDEMHIVLLDNGRSQMLGNAFHDMLRCIRCGACMNHCPVYCSVGGHAYGWVYAGPMGSVLTPLMVGLDSAYHLPHACTLNGRCQQVCPMDIPLSDMIRQLRIHTANERIGSVFNRVALSIWASFAKHPSWYRLATSFAALLLRLLGRYQSILNFLPIIGHWSKSRSLPIPKQTFMSTIKNERR